MPPPRSPFATPFAPQRGSTALGFLLTSIPVLMLGLGGIELSNWLWVRQALAHALLEAGRAASVDHARPQTLVSAFERALRPLYLRPGSLQRALAQRTRDTGQAPWRIRILAPARAAFRDHAAAGLAGASVDLRAINHDYQALQHRQRLAQGWPEGRGPASGQTIFEANTLEIELIWAHQPLIPGVRSLMRAFGSGVPDYRGRMYAQGYLPMLRRLTLTMQSHPIDWPDSADGKVVHGAVIRMPTAQGVACTGFWGACAARGDPQGIDPLPGPPAAGSAPPETGPPGGDTAAGEITNGMDDGSGAAGEPAGNVPGAQDAPACGIHLCC